MLLLLLVVPVASRPLELRRLCRVCKLQFTEANRNYCRFHSGRWMGAENSKHYGSRSGGKDTGLSLFWDCCDAEDEKSPGCCVGYHMAYGEELNNSSLLNRKI